MPRARSLQSLAIQQNAAGRSLQSGPPSPTFSEATNASQMNLGVNGPEKIITRTNLRASLQAYEDLVNNCANYRAALLNMSKATAAFADAMEACSGLKGVNYGSGTRLQAASGLHYLMGNHWHVLSDTLEKNFERPLRQHLDLYRTVVSERSASYERALREKSRIIRQTEMENMNIGRKKQRNLQTFREALTVLQRQVDELDELKVVHYQEILEHEEEVWDFVQGKVSLVVRSTLDVFDRFAAKASDPILEPMLQAIPDPFDSYGPPKPEDQIFSILPPLDILNNAPSPSPSPLAATPEPDDRPALVGGSKSWLGNSQDYASSEWADATSPPRSPSPPPRSTTPPVVRSASPSTIDSRPHSYPSSSEKSTHRSRKSETKLRNMLTVIDETRSDSSKTREASEDTVRVATPERNGRTQGFDFTWERQAMPNTNTSPEDVSDTRHLDFDQGSPPGHDPAIQSQMLPTSERTGLQLETE